MGLGLVVGPGASRCAQVCNVGFKIMHVDWMLTQSGVWGSQLSLASTMRHFACLRQAIWSGKGWFEV